MGHDWRTMIRQRMEERGISMKELSRRAHIGETGIRDILHRGVVPRVDTLASVARGLGMTLAELYEGDKALAPTAPLVGATKGTDAWLPYEDGAQIEFPLRAMEDDLVGLSITDDGLRPYLGVRRGDVIFGPKSNQKNAHNYIGRECIIATTLGDYLVRVLTQGAKPGTYTLRSIDPAKADMANIKIAWVAPITMIVRPL